ncbi:Hypothetical protein NTJ_13134 [Nesidiocoris tenuis]|uniref:D-aminoacyl-tRNA deacylase n=1 Tax=Nesidiocoris tenuis TaxID=355587 RepID=A0ABN7B7G9_9HEMI|nr:Hypothetical protein NTJ_13134 [Nesidiocoris tenuis]
MRALIQRVVSADAAYVNGEVISSIGRGLCVLVGVANGDTKKDIDYIVKKILNLKLFEDDESDSSKPFKKSVKDRHLEILCLSQITLYHTLKGNKLDFHHAMAPAQSRDFYGEFLQALRSQYEPDLVKEGAFGEHLVIGIKNDGPVTVMLESPKSPTTELEQTVPDVDG